MPFRIDATRTTIKILTNVRMPSLVYKARLSQSVPSNTRYIQEAICMRLSKDLGIPYESLLAELPDTRRPSDMVFGDPKKRVKHLVSEEVK